MEAGNVVIECFRSILTQVGNEIADFAVGEIAEGGGHGGGQSHRGDFLFVDGLGFQVHHQVEVSVDRRATYFGTRESGAILEFKFKPAFAESDVVVGCDEGAEVCEPKYALIHRGKTRAPNFIGNMAFAAAPSFAGGNLVALDSISSFEKGWVAVLGESAPFIGIGDELFEELVSLRFDGFTPCGESFFDFEPECEIEAFLEDESGDRLSKERVGGRSGKRGEELEDFLIAGGEPLVIEDVQV